MNNTEIFKKWLAILRLDDSWDILLEEKDDDAFTKTGDFKIDLSDKKAVLILNKRNPNKENIEEVIVHELLHLKLFPLDQLTESLIINNYSEGTKEYNTIYHQFMIMLEQTVEELTKCFLASFGENKQLSYGRCHSMKSYNELYDEIKIHDANLKL